MAKTARIKQAATAPVPQNEADVNAAIRKIGDLQRVQDGLKNAMDGEIATVKAGYEAPLALAAADLETLAQGVRTWCAANRDGLTGGGKVKTARFLAGEVSWRTRPPKVTVRGVVAVIDRLTDLGLTRFIRTKREVDKDAMRADPIVAAAVEGVKIASGGEDFVIKPDETKLEEII
ncbi:host-nuclease inhibitor Gam family protein [Varunaivibrio sulfuroxidans]|uniref:Phage host-nuclease inhibitor protein Gam n=1 Tax=Varunaivibrio sulfuroxidans TaxID=1773489 RepID=A0A4R3JAI3_9PROT|nr:host-nuclease inhibitor Gam family protein [Varunaivibrio sulfuroxidans]TCS62564.1 phage host-nuclease inhibitor protein Gam [Varunaivibrio sulfuroxidans]WES30767.1 host-nuclease inhibitor Gam family protein [Varunaivibrio sulfuroxidans]